MDFDIRFKLEIDKIPNEETGIGSLIMDDKYEITDIFELINMGQVSIQKQGDEKVLIDNSRGNIRIGTITNVELA